MCRIVVVLMIVGLCVHTAAALPGSGTQQDPYRIESLADFDEFASDPIYWAGFTRLETDVNLAGRTYSTAVIAPDVNNSNWQFDGTAFTGVFDGNDHKITNLSIDDGGAGNWYLGLFGCIDDGEVRNLRLEGGSVRGDFYVGGLVGENGGSVSNCYSTGSVSGNSGVAGLVGANGDYCDDCVPNYPHPGYIIDSYSTGDVNGVDDVGGLVGANEYGSISNSYSTGNVSGTGWGVGGLVGANFDNVSNCYSTGDVNGTANYVGGLVGYNVGSISNCYSTGDVNGVRTVGGLIGANSWAYSGGMFDFIGHILNSYSTGDVNGYDSVGGLVAANYGSLSNCYSTGDVNGIDYVGGLVGQNGFYSGECERPPCWPLPGYISNSYSTGDVNGIYPVGGLVGYNEAGDIESSFWDVQTSGEPNMCGGQEGRFGWATGCDPNCGRTTAEMQTRSTFTDAGWDFVEIWLINDGATYPVLRQEIRSDLSGDGGVDFVDFALFADHWLEEK